MKMCNLRERKTGDVKKRFCVYVHKFQKRKKNCGMTTNNTNFLILFALTLWISHGQLYNKLCNGKGYKNAYGVCECMTGFYGQNCEYQKCPFGPSWLYPPISNNVRNSTFRPCSDMGYCNPLTGKCECRSGYDGRACERTACPTTLQSFTAPNISMYKTVTVLGKSTTTLIKVGMDYGLQCSGHGVCKTLREISRSFNGYSVVHPPIDYNNWDSDRVQGCVCDFAWEGVDCSRRSCPKGRDPTIPSTLYDVEETFVLQCQANAGYFSIFALGYYTDPIPYDADPGYLKYALEAIPTVGKVTVVTKAYFDELPIICGSSQVVSTKIMFNSYFGDRPPIYLSRNTSSTRQWPDGSSALTLHGMHPVLRMVTDFTLKCPVCTACQGNIYFVYKKSTSTAVDITQLHASTLIKSAILELGDLMDENWANLNISVQNNGPNDKICNTASSTAISIHLYSDYGNIPSINVVDATYTSSSSLFPANISISSNKGNGTLYECSNQGSCDYNTGVCTCNQQILSEGEFLYRAVSSDGKGSHGGRGDCGYFHPKLSSCYFQNQDICNGHGVCSNSTITCSCYDGWFGVTCASKQCPKGKAFFDEPISPSEAHQYVECSGAGLCDHQTGFCNCQSGFVGPACEIKDCYRDSSGVACSGHGSCVNMAQYFKFYNFSYGNSSSEFLDIGGKTWDALSWYECLCNVQVSQGATGNSLYPLVGPSTLISGTFASATPIPGWGSWDCSIRNCPKGDNTLYGYKTSKEVQRIVCMAPSSSFFQLVLFKQVSEKIYGYYDAVQIKTAIETMIGIGNVTIGFPNDKYDRIQTACNSSADLQHGGFLVRFETHIGDVPEFTLVHPNVMMDISEYNKGYSSKDECSGPNLGFCDTTSGQSTYYGLLIICEISLEGNCVCNKHFYSSDGSRSFGARGDCSFKSPHPTLDYEISLLQQDY